MDEDIKPFDITRMLLGQAPPEFLIEVFFRGLALYLFMLFIMRFLGKRMAGELTVTEMVLMVTLGGSVAVAIQVPEGGALLGFVVLTCAFLFERGLSWLTLRSPRIEKLTQGTMVMLVKDGVLQWDNMRASRITQEQVFATLRGKKIRQLGKVERLYLEASGTFSVYKKPGEPSPGLLVLPEDDEMIRQEPPVAGILACAHCGTTRKDTDNEACPTCGETRWTAAVL